MEICQLFVKYKIPGLLPTKLDYELLIRRIAANGESSSLQTLLAHPVLDSISVNIHAQSTNGLSALNWINQHAKQFPQKAADFAACREILSRYKEPHIATEDVTINAI